MFIPRLLHFRRDWIAEGFAGGAGFKRKLERAYPVEPRFLHEVEQRLEFLVRLAGVADDEGGAEREFGHGRPHFGKRFAHLLHVRRAAHPAEGHRVGVLEGHVQVWDQWFVHRHRLDHPVGDVAGEGVHDPDPVHIWDGFDQFFEQDGQPFLHPQIMPVIGRILGDQDQLPDPLVAQGAGLVQNRVHRAADRGPFDERDGAKRARAAAAIGDFDIRAGPLHRRAQGFPFVHPHRNRFGREVVKGFRMFLATELGDDIHNVHPTAGAEQAVNARDALHHFHPVALGQASGGDEELPAPFVCGLFPQHAVGLIPRGADEPAGVDEEYPRLVRVGDRAESGGAEELCH